MRGFYSTRDAWKRDPVWGTVIAVSVAAVALAASEGYQHIKAKIQGPDEYLVQMAESQKQEFAALKDSLGQIRSSLGSGDRAAYQQITGAVESLQKTGADLVQQLALAKRENETLRRIAEQKAGISGGYDLILSENSGVRLDAATVLGVDRITSGGYVNVNLSSNAETEPRSSNLQSGESIAYQAADGRACRVSLLASDDSGNGTASFAVACT